MAIEVEMEASCLEWCIHLTETLGEGKLRHKNLSHPPKCATNKFVVKESPDFTIYTKNNIYVCFEPGSTKEKKEVNQKPR